MNKTASQVRYEKAVQEMAKERFFKHPESLPEAIAKHYLSHAMVALEVAVLIKNKRQFPACSLAADKVIEKLVEDIKSAHVRDFGTELVDIVSPKAKAWQSYIDELDSVE